MILIRTRQNIFTRYKLKKKKKQFACRRKKIINLEFEEKFQATQLSKLTMSNFRKISFVSWITLYRILTFLLEDGLFKKDLKKKIKNKNENADSNYMLQASWEEKITFKYFFQSPSD